MIIEKLKGESQTSTNLFTISSTAAANDLVGIEVNYATEFNTLAGTTVIVARARYFCSFNVNNRASILLCSFNRYYMHNNRTVNRTAEPNWFY